MKRIVCGILIVLTGVAIGLYSTRTKPARSVERVTESSRIRGTSSSEQNDKSDIGRVPASARRTTGNLSPEQTRTDGRRQSGDAKAGVASATNLKLIVDQLVSPQASYTQKQQAWQQLRDSGKLDETIADLEERVSSSPQSAEACAALGQAYLQKAGVIRDLREQGILAMKADQVFDAALQTDPANWEARFTKAMAMSHWPPQLGKGQEVIDHFTQLILQQEAQEPQPQFAQSYLWLGDQYRKQGKDDYARAAWERGAALYPKDNGLAERLRQGAQQANDIAAASASPVAQPSGTPSGR